MVEDELLDEDFDDTDDQVMFLYSQLMNIPYSQIETLSEIERSLYSEISKNPSDNLPLIALMQVQTMLGNHEKAKAFAYKIWEQGGRLEEMEEYCYINNLLNLKLLDMASVLLKPKLANLINSIEYYYPLMMKFAVMSGNLALMDRLSSDPLFVNDEGALREIISNYKNNNYAEHFKMVQKIILEQVSDNLCAYEFDVSAEDFVTTIFLGGDNDTRTRLKREITESLATYYLSEKIDALPDFLLEVQPISAHPAENID